MRTRARPIRRAANRGLTLVEVLATMVLLAIVLPVAMRGLSTAMRAASSARHAAQASALGESKLNELIVSADLGLATASGDFGEQFPGYAWSVESYTGEFDVTEVILTVTWLEHGRQRSMQFATMTR